MASAIYTRNVMTAIRANTAMAFELHKRGLLAEEARNGIQSANMFVFGLIENGGLHGQPLRDAIMKQRDNAANSHYWSQHTFYVAYVAALNEALAFI